MSRYHPSTSIDAHLSGEGFLQLTEDTLKIILLG